MGSTKPMVIPPKVAKIIADYAWANALADDLKDVEKQLDQDSTRFGGSSRLSSIILPHDYWGPKEQGTGQ